MNSRITKDCRSIWHNCFSATLLLSVLHAAALALGASTSSAVPPEVLAAEEARIATIRQISEPTLAVFDSAGQGGGSGVVISADGYALTNFHVTAPCGPAMKCGMNDGRLYDAVIVGIDPPGDVALIKLLGRDNFPTAELGDSDGSKVGDNVFVVGNPFLLAEDYQPTVTYGILSGTHRYQYPSGTLLEYADCLQTDASINPGNSGGPLFNAKGQLIGINGRGSFEKRGRVNVGVGYAISINQIKYFLSHLKSGRIVDHATLGATVTSLDTSRVVVDDLLERSDAFRRGLRYGDRVLSFADREITTANAMKNALGIFPAGWRTTLTFRNEEKLQTTTVRLASLHSPGELEALVETQAQQPTPIQPPGPEDEQESPKLPDLPSKPEQAEMPKPVKDVYVERSGFANYHFNLRQQERLANACKQVGVAKPILPLVIDATDATGQTVRMVANETEGQYRSSQGEFRARFGANQQGVSGPPGSGGLLGALDSCRLFLTEGFDAFDEVVYYGQLPAGDDLALHDCIVATHHGLDIRFYFHTDTSQLAITEYFSGDDLDPCEISFRNFQPWQSGQLPYSWVVRYGDNIYTKLDIETYSQPDQSSNDSQKPGGQDSDE